MSESDDDYNSNESVEQTEIVKRIKPSISTPILKLGISIGMRRTHTTYTPNTHTPQLKRSILRPIQNTSTLVIPFKPPKMLKPFTGGVMRPGTSLGMRRSTQVPIHSLHDPSADDAFVVYRPKTSLSEDEKLAWIGSNPGKKPEFEVDVVIVYVFN